MNKQSKIAICTGLVLASGSALSATKVADARGNGMGNTGVASASYLVAPFYNPALTAMYEQNHRVGVLLPAVEASIQDKDDTLDMVDELQDLMDVYSDDLTTDTSISGLSSDLDRLNDYLDKLDDNKLTASAGAGIAVAIPNSMVSANIFTGGHVEVVAEAEVATLGSSTDTATYAQATQTRVENSDVDLYAFGYYEFGVAFAKQMQLMQQNFSFGISPKYQKLRTYSQADLGVNNFDIDDYDESEVNESAFNLDLGAVWFKDAWRVGAAVKDVFKQDIATKEGNKTYELKPQVTVAGSYATELFTAAVDVDLTKQTRFTGIEDDTQFIRFGVEGNAWNWAQLRLGYEVDTQDTLEDAITAGIGLSPFNVLHLDIAGSYADENQYGASANLALMF
ncbi:conjugal transfer protein TraF [Vibrio sp. JC009]|uniref:conjugal transfer protein TraF n=1 Tax=Vibrio sp. JC009 TaxID=2912314 RepID=UPI0023B196C0|nr:conjugal transfer protein TraF [Vibrio sp. JC009]WED24222.1 conjugal transfer protein TraF [Vibrio sp. JC009]